MVFAWLRRRKWARRARELMPSTAEMDAVIRAYPCLAGFGDEDRERLRQRTAEVLARFDFLGADGLAPDRADCLPVAVHVALPALEIGLEPFSEFRSFILYTDAFEADFEETDEAGVVHRGRDLRAGEAWHRGPVVLSLADVADSGQGDGFHVVVHELAHQIDHLNGEPDGYPPLPSTIRHEEWVEAFTAAWEALERDLEAGREPFIDDYAAESPAEFFAVACEFFFDVPDHLQRTLPDIYDLLSRLFRQNPATRLVRRH
ncbi:MAG: M90 family metallopeptidase [Wenzhouxiangellaceae bacterium]|nr:M90 family metallopeptidase [Wenzhouxiangellaceae bacterium]